ncbi:hypothetical protein GCM10025771_34720 [Niveibacterium umoris]|uniref:Cytochrome C oxidase subunit IV n=1 Tax=Niveibacterium umoris TaxID=1193620 RepID=A0A840BGL9_9RHOO|nr:cytochrome C oxidase subunit IV family protein [Niveibacterium umoris]MBB4011334.1 hypothetical protein [Niveibacterium umoris]
MKTPSLHREDIAFAVLLLATLATYALGEWDGKYRDVCRSGHVTVVSAQGAVAVVLALVTLIKGTLVAREFMVLRHVSLRWQAAVLGWLLLAIVLIGFGWYAASGAW